MGFHPNDPRSDPDWNKNQFKHGCYGTIGFIILVLIISISEDVGRIIAITVGVIFLAVFLIASWWG